MVSCISLPISFSLSVLFLRDKGFFFHSLQITSKLVGDFCLSLGLGQNGVGRFDGGTGEPTLLWLGFTLCCHVIRVWCVCTGNRAPSLPVSCLLLSWLSSLLSFLIENFFLRTRDKCHSQRRSCTVFLISRLDGAQSAKVELLNHHKGRS